MYQFILIPYIYLYLGTSFKEMFLEKNKNTSEICLAYP